MSINAGQLRDHVVVPTLKSMARAARKPLYSEAAVDLLMGTAWQESRGVYIHQLGAGPALSFWQMEPATASSLNGQWCLAKRANAALRGWFVAEGGMPATRVKAIAWNMRLACAYARIRYWVVPEGLPEAGDVAGLARYWKRYYNTHLGAGTEAEFKRSWRSLQRALA